MKVGVDDEVSSGEPPVPRWCAFGGSEVLRELGFVDHRLSWAAPSSSSMSAG